MEGSKSRVCLAYPTSHVGYPAAPPMSITINQSINQKLFSVAYRLHDNVTLSLRSRSNEECYSTEKDKTYSNHSVKTGRYLGIKTFLSHKTIFAIGPKGQDWQKMAQNMDLRFSIRTGGSYDTKGFR